MQEDHKHMLRLKPNKKCTKQINTVVYYYKIKPWQSMHKLKPESLNFDKFFNCLIEQYL